MRVEVTYKMIVQIRPHQVGARYAALQSSHKGYRSPRPSSVKQTYFSLQGALDRATRAFEKMCSNCKQQCTVPCTFGATRPRLI